MPTKSKKHSNLASSRLESPDQFLTSPCRNPDAEISERELLCSLEEASQKFPFLVSKNALVGKIHTDYTSAASIMEGLGSKGCEIWLSESSMRAASIAPASIVSVSLASSSKLSSHYPLCSIADEFALNFGCDIAEGLVDGAGRYFALATAFPSSQLSKNTVRLSSNLLVTMGCPASGRTVYVSPTQHHPVTGFNGCKITHSSTESYFSLHNCKDLDLSLVYSKGEFALDDMSPNISLLMGTTHVQDGSGRNSSPKTPVLPRSKFKPPSGRQLITQDYEDSKSTSQL